MNMVVRGHVKNGVIVLDPGASLPEGAAVRVDVVANGEPAQGATGSPTMFDSLGPLIGSLKGAPADLARNHDHYLYGVPKRP